MLKKPILLCLSLILLLSFTACKSEMTNEAQRDYGYNGYEYEDDLDLKEGSKSVAEKIDSDGLNMKFTLEDAENRKLIKDVSLDIETKSFDDFMKDLQSEIGKYKGFIQKSDIKGNSYDSSYNRYATIIARIPSDKLDEFMGKIPSSGIVINKTEGVEDVTVDYVDIESHIKALETEQESLLKLLEKADSLNDILAIESRLTDVRYEIEKYESKKRTFDDLIAYSTVAFDVKEVERVTKTDDQNMWQVIGNNLSDNFYEVGQFFRELFIGVASALPFILIIAVVAVIVLIIIRVILKREKKRALPKYTYPPMDKEKSKEEKEEK